VIGTALVGEWLGHGLAYYRSAGVAGLRAGLGGGIHGYMLPLAAGLLVAAVAGATWLTRAWLVLGRRLDASAALIARLRAGERRGPEPVLRLPAGGRRRGPEPSPRAGLIALGLLLGALQCALFLAQENLERVLQGAPAAGLAPLAGASGAATWIQLGVAAVLGAVLTAGGRLLRSRVRAVERLESVIRALCQRARVTTEVGRPAVGRRVVTVTGLLGSAVWQRPPPVSFAA
jgi:hypothetical protein